jgi:hypothetical protein
MDEPYRLGVYVPGRTARSAQPLCPAKAAPVPWQVRPILLPRMGTPTSDPADGEPLGDAVAHLGWWAFQPVLARRLLKVGTGPPIHRTVTR